MSRKRQRVSEDTESSVHEPGPEKQVNGLGDDQAPSSEPLEFSMETLNQIHTTCTMSTLVQQPLLEGTPFPS